MSASSDRGSVASTPRVWAPRAAGVELVETRTAADLEREGVRSFCDSYHQLLDCIEKKRGVATAVSGS